MRHRKIFGCTITPSRKRDRLIVFTENFTTTHSNPSLTARCHKRPPASLRLGHASLASASQPSYSTPSRGTHRGGCGDGRDACASLPSGDGLGPREGCRVGPPRSVQRHGGGMLAARRASKRARRSELPSWKGVWGTGEEAGPLGCRVPDNARKDACEIQSQYTEIESPTKI